MSFTTTIDKLYEELLYAVLQYEYSAIQKINTVEALTRLNMVKFAYESCDDSYHIGGYARSKSKALFDWNKAWHNTGDDSSWSSHYKFNEFGEYKDHEELNKYFEIDSDMDDSDKDSEEHSACKYSKRYGCQHVKKYIEGNLDYINSLKKIDLYL